MSVLDWNANIVNFKKKIPDSSNSPKFPVAEGKTDISLFHKFSKPLANFSLWGDAEQVFPKALNPNGEKTRSPHGKKIPEAETLWTLLPWPPRLYPLIKSHRQNTKCAPVDTGASLGNWPLYVGRYYKMNFPWKLVKFWECRGGIDCLIQCIQLSGVFRYVYFVLNFKTISLQVWFSEEQRQWKAFNIM